MEKNLGDIRKLLKYEFELGHNAKEAVTNINRAKGAGTMAYSTAKRWFSKFRCGNVETDDKKRSDRPREVDRNAIVNTVEDHPSMTTLQKIRDIGWERLEHPPYSPDHSQSDYYLFRSMEHWLRGKKFTTIEEMRESLTEFFASKGRDW